MFPSKMFLHIFHTSHSILRCVQVKCCTIEILCAYRLWKIRGNIARECLKNYFEMYSSYNHFSMKESYLSLDNLDQDVNQFYQLKNSASVTKWFDIKADDRTLLSSYRRWPFETSIALRVCLDPYIKRFLSLSFVSKATVAFSITITLMFFKIWVINCDEVA